MSKLTIETLRTALIALKCAGLRVHHVEIGLFAWLRLESDLRDDVGYGSHPAGVLGVAVVLPILEGVVLVPNALIAPHVPVPCEDEWAVVFGLTGNAAIDYKLTPEHRALYEKRGKPWTKEMQASVDAAYGNPEVGDDSPKAR